MNKNTVITYASGGNTVVFRAAPDSPFWITEITGVSGNRVNIVESQGAGQVGATISSQSVQPKDITINGALIGGLEANRRAMLACVVPGVSCRLTLNEGGESWYIDGAPRSTPEFSDGSHVQSFQFVVHCPYPYWRSIENQPTQLAGLINLLTFPLSLAGSWYISQYTPSLLTVVNNSGAAPSGFDLTFEADSAVTNPELYHVERRAYIRINKVMAAGERFVVSTVYGRKGVTYTDADSVENNGFRYLDVGSDLSLQLYPGDNTLRVTAADNREGLRVSLVAPKGVRQGI